jgi:hypothetical protein
MKKNFLSVLFLGAIIFLGTHSPVQGARTQGGSGSGTVTSVDTDTTLTGGTITTSGTLGLNLATANKWTAPINLASGVLGYQMEGKLLAYASSTNQDTIFGLGAGGQNATTSATVTGNTAIGYFAMNAAAVTGSANTAVGFNALKLLTTASGIGGNTAVGGSAGAKITTGYQNTSFGQGSLQTLVSGTWNTAFGVSALNSTTGNHNTGLGTLAGANISSGSANIIIGSYANAPVAGNSNQLNIGNVLYGTGVYGTNISSSYPTANGNIGIGTTTPWGKLTLNLNSADTNLNAFLIASSTATATTTLFSIDNVGNAYHAGNVGIGTTTTRVSLSVVQAPIGDGTIATTTIQIGNISTTTSKSSIQMNNTAGAAECLYIVGTTITVTAGTCN